MVSFHTPLSPTRRKEIRDLENSPKKRKWEEPEVSSEVIPEKRLLIKSSRSAMSVFDRDHHHELINLETRPPFEWQRDLDVKSIHDQPQSPGHMSLDLQLNPPCGSISTTKNKNCDNYAKRNPGCTANNSGCEERKKKNSGGLARCPSWLAFEGDQREMVTAVCKKCHMLVMMYKSSPACPNCKFMHSPDQSPPSLFKQRELSLLC